MTGGARISVLVPCYNERPNVERYPAELLAPLQCLGDCEFVFVDDGSTDGTWESLLRLAEGRYNMVLVHHLQNMGLARALQDGFNRCTGEAVLTLDADLTFSARDAAALIEHFEGYDCVVGSPFLSENTQISRVRYALSFLVNRLYAALVRATLTAFTPILRLYRREVLLTLPLQSIGFEINAEILCRLLQDGRRICELPATLTRRRFGRSKVRLRDAVCHLRLMSRLLRSRWAAAPAEADAA